MYGLDNRVCALLALRGKPIFEWSLRAHCLVQALSQRYAAYALPLLSKPRPKEADLFAKLELRFGIVSEERVRHVVISAYALTRISQVKYGFETGLDSTHEIAHATILSAYSKALAQGSVSCTMLPATW